jgi:farnesyl diphosphate synthase
MRYSVLGGDKRLRPILVYTTGEALGASLEQLDIPAAAVELVHVYSLVHDDLPAMDNDDLRRGRPTCHRAFDEATAILVGDALQALAFDVLAQAPIRADIALALVRTLAPAAGAVGMCGGQALDLDATGRSIDVDVAALETLHSMKTGALIRAAVRMGALVGGADAPSLARLDDFARALGLAFQVRDDILDVEADTAQLGKTAGKDVAQDKATFPALIGLDASKARLVELAARMEAAVDGYGPRADGLRALARMAVQRDH